MPIWRMWRTGPNASASIASIRARIRACRRGGAGDAVGRALPALGAVLGGAALGRVDDLAREHRVAARGEAGLLREREEVVREGPAQMGLGEIEADPAFLDDEAGKPVGLGGEQLLQRARSARLRASARRRWS